MKTTRRTERWYQPDVDTGAEFVPVVAPTTSVAQFAGAFQQADWSESAPNSQSWYQPDAEVVPGPLKGTKYSVGFNPSSEPTGTYPFAVTHSTGTVNSYFRLDEFSGENGPAPASWYTAYDYTVQGPSGDGREAAWQGVIIGRRQVLAADAAGPNGSGVLLDGSTAFAAVKASNWFTIGLGDFAIEAWFRTTASGSETVITTTKNATGVVVGVVLYMTAGGVVVGGIANGTVNDEITSIHALNDGLRHHVVYTRSGSNAAIYVDGHLDHTSNSANLDASGATSGMRIGSYLGGTGFFNGDVAEVAWYVGNVPTAQDVDTHYLIGSGGWPPMVQQSDWSESASNGQQWFAPDAEVSGIPPFQPSTATAAQQTGIHQPGYDEQVNHSQFWFAPESEWTPIPNLTEATVAQEPVQQDDWSEAADRTLTWFAPEEMGFWTPIPGLTQATVQQQPIQQPDPSEQVDLTQRWYQPDTGAEFVQFVAPVVLTTAQLAGLWQEQPGQEAANTQSWFAPDEAIGGIPPFAPSSATTAQQAGIHQPDPSEQVSRVVTWYQPDTGAEWTPAIYAKVTQDLVEVFFVDATAAAKITQDLVEVFFQMLPDAPVFDWTDHSPQFWNYPFWFQDEAQAWAPFTPAPPAVTVPQEAGLWQEQVEPVSSQQQWFAPEESFWVPIPGLTQASVAQQPIQQPSADEDIDRTQTWFQLDAEQAWVPLANPSSVTVAQEAGLWQEQPYPEAGNQQQWFTPEEEFRVAIPNLSAATVAQEPIQQPSVDEEVDRTARWYQEPDGTLGIPPFAPSTATVAQQAALWSEPQPDEQVDRSQRWYQEPDDQLGAVPIIITTATVAQQAPVWYEQPGQEASVQPQWFAPESEWTPIPNLTEATVAQEPIQVAGDDEQLDRTVRWFQLDAEQAWVNPGITGDAFPLKQVDDWSESASNAQQWFAPEEQAWVPLANPSNATTAQEPIQQPSADEELDHSLVWFAPDEMAPWVPIPNLTVATTAQFPIQQPGADENTDRTIVWFSPDAEVNGIPPFQPSSATVAQQAGLWIDGSGQQDASIAQLWFQDEHCQWLPVFATFTIATVPQQAPLWIEQPVAWNDGTPWFSPEESFDGFPPRVNAPTHPDYGWDAQQDRDLTQTWFAPDASVEGLTPRVNAYTGFDIGWDAQFDVDLTQRWFTPEELLWTPEPFETEDAFPWKQEDDPSEQIANGQQWFQPEDPFVFTPAAAITVAQYPIQTDDLSEQADRTSTWFQPDTEQWTPIPGLTQATTAQEPIQQPSVDEDVDRTVVWFQPDAEQAWTPNPGQSQATVAQQPIQQPDWAEAAPNGQAWFTPDEQVWTPQAVQPTQAAIPQVDDWSEQFSTAITWFTPEEQAWTPRNVPPTMPPPPQVDDPSEQVANQPTWFQDEHQAWLDEPNLTEDFYPLKQVDSLDEQADRTQQWFQDEHQAWTPVPGLTQATVAQQAALWPEQPGQEASNAQLWFQPDDAYETPVPYGNEPPTTAMFGALGQQPDASEQRPTGQQWFAPDEQAWVPIPKLTQPTVAQRAAATQAYERVEQLDLSLRWYQEPDDTLGTQYEANLVRPGRVTPTDAGTSLVIIIDTSNIVIPGDQPANFVDPADAVSAKVVASDAATLGVVASDTD